MVRRVSYQLSEVEPYINWLYFDHAWGLTGKPEQERTALREEARQLLRRMDGVCMTHAVFGLFEANSDGDDIIIGGMRMPMLRQQTPGSDGYCLCLADFVRPAATGEPDTVGAFATTVDVRLQEHHADDPYLTMLAQTLADRLAEATAEKMHQHVRRVEWGYAPDEQLTIDELHREAYQGIRPAVGYPSLPDTSLNFLLERLITMSAIGIRLTEHGAMRPHASVSGLMLAHPEARYFDLGPVGADQLDDYARRRGIPLPLMRKFVKAETPHSNTI